MELLQVHCEKAMPRQCESMYQGIAFDGCYFYLTCPNSSKIVKYDRNFCKIDCCSTLRQYSCICYDQQNHCFWASSDKCFYKLFKLNCSLEEIDCISINENEFCGAKITGISYDCQNKCLLVSCANCIITICTTGCNDITIIRKSCSESSLEILSISPSYMVIETQMSKQCISVYDCNFILKSQFKIPNGYVVESIVFDPCASKCDGNYHFYLLTTKDGCYSFIWECIFDSCNFEIGDCNYCICNEDHCEPDCQCSKQAYNDLIESIALIETALSHILNAEGEKLQKIIACTENVDEILCTNKSISDTIVKITHLEIVLHDKLALIKSCCNACDEEKNPCCE